MVRIISFEKRRHSDKTTKVLFCHFTSVPWSGLYIQLAVIFGEVSNCVIRPRQFVLTFRLLYTNQIYLFIFRAGDCGCRMCVCVICRSSILSYRHSRAVKRPSQVMKTSLLELLSWTNKVLLNLNTWDMK